MSHAAFDANLPTSLAADKLMGVQAIAEFISEPPRRVFRMCQNGKLPVGRTGRIYIASKTELLRHYRQMTSGRASA